MRIALIGNDYVQQFPLRGYGGIETCVENLAQGLHSEGYDFFVVVPKRSSAAAYPFSVLETNEPPTSISRSRPDKFIAEVREILRSERPDIIWSQSHWSAIALQELGIPIICTFHDSTTRQDGWLQQYDNVRYRFISHFQYDTWVREAWEAEQSFMCYTGLTEDNYRYFAKDAGYYLWCAGLNWGLHAKGLDTFLELARRNPDKHFVVHGAGKKKLELYLKWKSLTQKNLEYRGALTRGDAHMHAFGEARAFIMPTKLPEAFGRTSVEALSKGTPVIGSRHGANPEIIGTSGWCTDSIDEMSEALSRTYDRAAIFEASKRFHIREEIAVMMRESVRML